MITKTYFNERPIPLFCQTLPDGRADVWMRKNIEEVSETKDCVADEAYMRGYVADEAYMRGFASEAEIALDFDGWYERASAWKPETEPAPQPTPSELAALIAANNTATQLAIAELAETVLGGV